MIIAPNTVSHGHVMDFLSAMPRDACHTVITSPPYWAVRAYPIEPTLWCADPTCKHEWEDCGTRRVRNTVAGKAGFATDTGKPELHRQRVEFPSRGRICTRCKAWFGCHGMEPTPSLFVRHAVEIFRLVRDTLHPSGSLWMNYGDGWAMGSARRATAEENAHDLQRSKNRGYPTNAFAGQDGWDRCSGTAVEGLKAKDLMQLPFKVAEALRADGWWLRDTIIWEKDDPTPCGVWDKITPAHEFIFRFTKIPGAPTWKADKFDPAPGARTFFDREAIRLRGNQTMNDPELEEPEGTPGYDSSRLPRTVWRVRAKNDVPRFKGLDLGHYATFPLNLIRPMVLSTSSAAGVCPTCGEPWWPLYRPAPGYMEQLGTSWHPHEDDAHRGQVGRKGEIPRVPYILTEYRKGCSCPHSEPVPAVVLDPFMGSGTVAEMALRKGRTAIGCEIMPTWCDFANARIAGVISGNLPSVAEGGRGYAMAQILSGQGDLF